MMGGWIRRGDPPRHGERINTEPEYNVACDPAGLRALLDSGVPTRIMPLDATTVPLRPVELEATARGGALGEMLRTLFEQWHRGSPFPDRPTLFDVVPVVFLLRPSVCAPQPMRIGVTGRGLTEAVTEAPNASVRLSVDARAVQLLLDRTLDGR